MKQAIIAALFATQSLLLSPLASAEETLSAKKAEIPTQEQDFVKAINRYTKAEIIAQFGEPAKADDVKVKNTGKVVATIWLYHFINTSADGEYYPTTELDFIDDKVVMVAFLNNDGSEGADAGQQYEPPM